MQTYAHYVHRLFVHKKHLLRLMESDKTFFCFNRALTAIVGEQLQNNPLCNNAIQTTLSIRPDKKRSLDPCYSTSMRGAYCTVSRSN